MRGPTWSWESNRETLNGTQHLAGVSLELRRAEQRPPNPSHPRSSRCHGPQPPPAQRGESSGVQAGGASAETRWPQAPAVGSPRWSPLSARSDVHAAMSTQRCSFCPSNAPWAWQVTAFSGWDAGLGGAGQCGGPPVGLWLPPGLAGGPRQEGGGEGSECGVHPHPCGLSGADRLPARRPPLAVVLDAVWLAGEASRPCEDAPGGRVVLIRVGRTLAGREGRG